MRVFHILWQAWVTFGSVYFLKEPGNQIHRPDEGFRREST